MESKVIEVIVTQGPFAILFVWLLLDTRKEAKSREDRLIGVINGMQGSLEKLAINQEKICDDIDGIQKILKGGMSPTCD